MVEFVCIKSEDDIISVDDNNISCDSANAYKRTIPHVMVHLGIPSARRYSF